MKLGLLVALQIAVSAASLVVEIVAGRMLAPHVGMSLYTWTSVIAVVLAGFSAGHWWGGRLADRGIPTALAATGWILLAGALSTALATTLLAWLAGPVLAATGHPVWGIVALTVLVFFLPSLFAGVPAPVLAHVAVTTGTRPGRALGALFAAGAVGAIAGTLLAGFLFISWLGSSLTLALVTLAYAVAGTVLIRTAGRTAIAALALAALALALAGLAAAAPGPCDRESRYFCIRSVDISADRSRPVRMMVIDHLAHGISARDAPLVMFTDHAAMLDALARLRAPRPGFTSFFIGGGNYAIPRALALRGAGKVTVAEIDPEVTEIAVREFWFDAAGTEVIHEDARRALAASGARYDIIIGDAFTDIAVPQHLVTKEFFQLVRDRLAPRGSYLMNVIDFEDRLDALAAITRTLAAVFPVVEVWTEQRRPEPGERVVFVVVAGHAPTAQDTIRVPSPDQTAFGAMADGFVAALIGRDDLVLTDDFSPIDRLIGRPD